MTHATNLVEQFRAATPSQRFDLHAAMVRDYGTGFANTLRDLVESDELIRCSQRPAPRNAVLRFPSREVAA